MASSITNSPGGESNTKNSKRSFVANGTAILTNLVNLIVDEETADVKLIQGDRVIPAHKVLLMASSSFFKRMFLGEWKESTDQQVQLHDIPECQAVFSLFLGFLYSGHTALTVDNVAHLSILADKYDVPPLLDLCKGYMIGIVEEGNLDCALKWLPFADLFCLDDIKISCTALIAHNIEAAAELQLWRHITIDQLVDILHSEVVIVTNEFALFSAVEKRLLAEDLRYVTDNTKVVMKCINFKMMTNAELLQVEKSKIIAKAGIGAVKDDLMEAFRHNALASDNLDDGDIATGKTGRWYQKELHLKSVFTNGTAPIHIATSSTGRDIQQSQGWILRIQDQNVATFPHMTSAEIVASKETGFVNSPTAADRYNLQAKFAICNTDGTVYWTPTVHIEDVKIPDQVGDPLVVLDLNCHNMTSMFMCKCTAVPEKVYYTVNLRKLRTSKEQEYYFARKKVYYPVNLRKLSFA